MKTCPKCYLRHEDETITCDCGFALSTLSTVTGSVSEKKTLWAAAICIIIVSGLLYLVNIYILALILGLVFMLDLALQFSGGFRIILKMLTYYFLKLLHLGSLATSVFIFWTSGIMTALGFSLLYWVATPIIMTSLNMSAAYLYETVVPLNAMENFHLMCHKLDGNPHNDSFLVLDRYRILRVVSAVVNILLWVTWITAALYLYY